MHGMGSLDKLGIWRVVRSRLFDMQLRGANLATTMTTTMVVVVVVVVVVDVLYITYIIMRCEFSR